MALRSAVMLVAGLGLLGSTGCLVLKPQHDELEAEVMKLRKQLAEQTASTQQTMEKAEKLTAELETKLAEVEEVLRRNQADIGLRVDNLEYETQDLRGAAENADYQATAAATELTEMREDLEARLQALEQKLNEATNIPETKSELWAESEKQFKAGKYKLSRRLWRTYLSRYANDPKVDEVRFQIGLTYFSEREYKSALGEFYRIIQDTPDSKVVPDALYYSGLAFAKLGQCENAIAYFDALRQKRTRAPKGYKEKAAEQIKLLKANKGRICEQDDDPNDRS